MRLFPEAYFIPAYELLKSKEIPQWDFHIHADYSDGKATIPQIFGEAIKQELEVIVLTEHTESWRTDKIGWFKCYVDEIEKNRAIHQNEISAFIGVEANALSFDGDVELTDEMRKDAEFVLGAAHRYPGLEGRRVFELNHTEAVDLEFKTLLGLAGSNEIDAIAHIGDTCAKYGLFFR